MSLAVRPLLDVDIQHPIIVKCPSVRFSSNLEHEVRVDRGRLTALSAFKAATIAASQSLALRFGQGPFIRKPRIVPTEWKAVVKQWHVRGEGLCKTSTITASKTCALPLR